MNQDEKLFIAKVWFMIGTIVITGLTVSILFVHYLLYGG